LERVFDIRFLVFALRPAKIEKADSGALYRSPKASFPSSD
jgi:hypothetical protein